MSVFSTGFAFAKLPLLLAGFGLVLSTTVFASSVYASPVVGVERATGEVLGNEFTFEISPTQIVVGEPVYLRLQVKNTSGNLVVGNFSSRLYMAEGNDLEVRVQEPGQLPRRYSGVEEPGIYGGTEINLGRNDTSLHDFLLLYDRSSDRGVLFDEPGEYIITARLAGSVYREANREVLTLPPTRITVRPPSTEEDQRAMDFVGSRDMAKSLHTAINMDPAIIERIKSFTATFPKSPWTPLALSVLANNYLYGPQPNGMAAARMYTEIASRFPDSPRAPAALFSAVIAYSQLNDEDSARAAYWLLRDLYPGYPLIRKDNPTAQQFEFGPSDSLVGQPWFHYMKPYVAPPKPMEQ
jgi:hypothetical protein